MSETKIEEEVRRWENRGVGVWLPACYPEWGGKIEVSDE